MFANCYWLDSQSTFYGFVFDRNSLSLLFIRTVFSRAIFLPALSQASVVSDLLLQEIHRASRVLLLLPPSGSELAMLATPGLV